MIRQRGSFLIICLVMMTLIVILSFAVLHSITAEIDVSTGNQRYLLAEEAAKSGLDHAIEQILIDYNQTSVTLPNYIHTSDTVPAVTFLDGAYRAPFTSINFPNSLSNLCDNNDPANTDNDVRAEDYVLRPWAWWWFDVNGNWGGNLEYDGRGRYYEPGYYNVTPNPVNSPAPLVATQFVNLAAAVPERSQGIFYDEQFRRITPSGNPAADRAAARYRLRYAVGVEDLSGHLLINPMPDMQMLSDTGQNIDYRTPAKTYAWMTTASNCLGAIAGAADGGSFAAQLEHVFQGRGYHTNADFDHSSSGIAGWPKTYPLMYRNHPEYGLPPLATGVPVSPGGGSWESFRDGLHSSALTNQLYFSGNGSVKGLAAGGEVIPTGASNDNADFWPYTDGTVMHCLMGPQLSFQNASYAAHGESGYLGPEGTGGSGSPRPWDNFVLTPYGRVLLTAQYTPGKRKWYQGHVSTPFYINVMTAPPAIINDMLLAYLPPVEKIVQYTSMSFFSYQGLGPDGGRIYNTITDAAHPKGNYPIDGNNAANQGMVYGRDLLVNTTMPPAFAPWNAPSRVDAPGTPAPFPPGAYNPPGASGIGQAITPDYYAIDTRNPLACYPGAFMNGNSSVPGQGSDDLGAKMDEASLTAGFDLYNKAPFSSLPGGSPYAYYSNFYSKGAMPNAADLSAAAGWASIYPPAGWGQNLLDYASKYPPAIATLHNNSYFLDLISAMGVAVGVMRAEYTEYDIPGLYTQSQFFGKGKAATLTDPNPSQFESLHDLDRVFLAEMGESISAPGTNPPAVLAANGNLKAYKFFRNGVPAITPDYIPENNIYSLVNGDLIANDDKSVTSIQRGHVMELMLNDFRMSFLGSSPDYSDGIDPNTGQPNSALQFMPLDFDGDGMVYCSCYHGLDKDGLPCAAKGTVPPCYFTVSGNLYMGKSHFYRIFSRGEIWDNFLNRKLDSATLDSVISVDPEGNNPLQTQMLYQRWFYNRYYANITHVQR